MRLLAWPCFNESVNFKKEILAGITNFMAIAYIIIVNPMVMSTAGHGFPISATVSATVLVIVVMTMFVGFFVKLPLAIAPGMGFNAILAYTLVIQQKLPPTIALGVIFWASLLFLVFALSGLQKYIVTAIPDCLQKALPMGLGFFLIFIGLKNANIIISDPDTYVRLGHFNLNYCITLLGFFVTATLFIRSKNYALLAPIVIITLIAYFLGITQMPEHIFAKPDFQLFNTVNILGSFKYSLLPVIFSVFLVSYFDATTLTISLISQIDFDNDKTKQQTLNRALISEPIGGLFSSMVGTANGIIYIESAAGVKLGARTGLAALVTSLLFVPFLFLAPMIGLIPLFATTPTLVLVGILMIDHGRDMSIKHLEEVVAVALTVIMMPLTFSVTSGAVFGILSYVILKLLLGKYKEISPTLAIMALVCSSWFLV